LLLTLRASCLDFHHVQALSTMADPERQTSLEPPWRIGIDVGGTFTDLVMVDRLGAIRVIKVPSTPEDPSDGVLAAVDQAAGKLGISTQELLACCNHFVHASTVATNVVIEGQGGPVGMLVTRGFRDSVQIRRGMRRNAWDHRVPFPPVLAPRYLRRPVSGRIDRNGEEFEPLSTSDVLDAIEFFKQEGVQSLAVCLFNSFLNDIHELTVGQIIKKHYPDAWITLSSHVTHVMGEYERSSTALLNAYIAPKIVSYMTRLSDALTNRGLKSPLLVVQNNGGTLTVDNVRERPISLLLSGPAAGVGALSLYGKTLGRTRALSMEIGGTSCDVMLISDDGAEMASEFEFGGYHVALPSIDIHSIGAGGGTVAGVDRGGMLFAGPQGAGADPGPAAYGRGGSEPTVTDAQLVLGRLKPGPLSGDRHLDLDLAVGAIETRIAKPLGMTVERAAAGMLRIVEQQLYHAVEKISAQRGHDPRRFTLVAAGGAGPMHGCAIGRMLNVGSVYVPRLAGAFCALGMLNAPVRHEFGRTLFCDIGEDAEESLTSIITEYEMVARDQLDSDGFLPHEVQIRNELELRHPGQIGALPIELPQAGAIDWSAIVKEFKSVHQRLYGHKDDESLLEIAGVRVVGIGFFPSLIFEHYEPIRSSPPVAETRLVYFEDHGERVPTSIFNGSDLFAGAVINGPAIVEETTTSIVIEPQAVCSVDEFGNYSIQLSQSEHEA